MISQWNDPAEAATHIPWTREFWSAVEPFASGEVYVNHLDAKEVYRIRTAYRHGYDRLVALKNKYDPTNLFRLNQNIKADRVADLAWDSREFGGAKGAGVAASAGPD